MSKYAVWLNINQMNVNLPVGVGRDADLLLDVLRAPQSIVSPEHVPWLVVAYHLLVRRAERCAELLRLDFIGLGKLGFQP